MLSLLHAVCLKVRDFFPLPLWCCCPIRAITPSFFRILEHTQRRTTVGGTPLDELSARRRDLYVTTHSTQKKQTSMPPGRIRTHNIGQASCCRPLSQITRPQGPAKYRVTFINLLTPNDPYMSRTAPLASKRCILYTYSTNIGTEYFKHALYSPFFLFKMQFVS